MAKTQIQGVLFDVDGTLYHQGPLRMLMVWGVFSDYFLQPTSLRRKIKIIRFFREGQEYLRTKVPPQENCRAIQLAYAAKKSGESLEETSRTVEKWFFKKPLSVLPHCRRKGLTTLLGDLRKNDLRLGILSDYPAEAKLKALEIDHFFSVVVSSWDEDVQGFKPNTTGFSVAAYKMGLAPENILYVGDRPEVDGTGARKAGMPVAIIGKGFGFKKLLPIRDGNL